jgi:FKBP-type peptidyl-prolyl cis-trans isomerase SlyD
MKSNNLLILNDYREVIGQDKVVRLRFRVADAASGELLQYGDDLFYLHGGYGGAFPKVEKATEGCRVGDAGTLVLSPEEGYGYRDPSLVLTLPAEDFRHEMPEPGELVEGALPDGQSMMFTVSRVSEQQLVLDGNHPFAGKQLDFRFEVLAIRDSTESERCAGFAFDGMFC